MVNVVFLTDKDDRNIKKQLIFFNFEFYLFVIYIIRGFPPIGLRPIGPALRGEYWPR